jgi:hypothetical protein
VEAVVFVLSSLMVFVVGKRIHNTLTGLVAALLVLSDPFTLIFRVQLGPENWLKFFGLVTLACLLVWVESHSGRWLMLAGAASAAAFWSFQFGALAVILVFSAVIWGNFHEPPHSRIIRDELLTALVGMLIVSAPFLAYFIINNATTQFIQAIIRVPFTETSATPGMIDRVLSLQSPLHMIVYTYPNFENKLLWPIFLVYLFHTSWRWGHDGKADKSILLIAYFASFYLVIIAYWPNSAQHTLPLTPIMAVGAASLIVTLFEREITWLRALLIHPARIFQLRSNIIPFISGILLLSIISMSVVSVPSSVQKVQGYWLEAPPSDLVAYIDRWTIPNQRILVPTSTLIYYFSERQPAIAHFFHGYTTDRNAELAEIRTAVRSKSVALIVIDVSSNDFVEFIIRDEVRRSAAYHIAAVVGKYVIYAPNEPRTPTDVFYGYNSQGELHSEGNESLSGLGYYPTNGHVPASIPNGRYTITANIPFSHILSTFSSGAWTSNPSTGVKPVEFSSRTMSPTNITLSRSAFLLIDFRALTLASMVLCRYPFLAASRL